MEVLMSFLAFLIKLIGWAIVAIGTGIYCVWSVICSKVREERDKIDKKPENQTTI